VDGTTLTVRRSDELWTAYGSASGSYYPQVAVSVLFDVLRKSPLDVHIDRYASSEREALMVLLENLKAGDLLVLDRGYPSYEVIDMLTRMGIDFVIRMPEKAAWPAVDAFLASDRLDCSFPMHLRKTVDGTTQPAPNLRLVRCSRGQGESVTILTSLTTTEATRAEVDDLYHERWAIEELYKLSKGLYLNQRQMHSMTVAGVEQEIYAFFLFIALAQSMRLVAAHGTEFDHRDLSQKAAILATGRALVSLILSPIATRRWRDTFQRTAHRITRRVDKRRPGRSFPRRSFQPRLRWGPVGRLGKVG
jgi:hypothetical protein